MTALFSQDVDVEFDTTLLSGNDRGWHVLMLRYQDKDNYHGFGFHAGGKVYGFTALDGERTVWQDSENFAAIRTGFGQVNHVRATATGTTLRFYINGQFVTETDQPSPLEGRVGLSVSALSGDSANGPTQVAFDNVVIRGPMDESGPAAAENGMTDQSDTEIVFQDDFSTDSGAWTIGPRDSGDRAIEGGQLRITDLDTNVTTTSYLDRTYTDLDIEFDTVLLSGSDRGWHVVYLRYQDKDNYHGFAFHLGGKIYGFTMLNGERTEWQNIAPSSAIRTSFGAINHVRAIATGTTLRFYINGELVAETNQSAPMEGRVAVSVSAPSGDYANGPTEIAFDNVVIRAPVEAINVPVEVPEIAPSSQSREVSARCEEIEVPPPSITSSDNVTVSWVWTARDVSYLGPHLEAVNYIVTLDGVPLRYSDPLYRAVDAGDHTIHALTWTVDVGPLSTGTHRVDYFATWSTAVSTGLTAYGPGTDHPTQVGGCTFEVTDGAGTAPSAVNRSTCPAWKAWTTPRLQPASRRLLTRSASSRRATTGPGCPPL